MKLEFGFGTGVQAVDLPEKNLAGILMPNEVPIELTGEAEVQRALLSPIGSLSLSRIVNPGEKIAIVTSDITRPMPTAVVMPLLLDALYEAGAKPADITLVFALGSHRKHTE
ncbi:MAG TPA: transcriptional regulator, partial [Ruminiclostridium sp.]|nr:transcriptional regulator [Ruminiclostridium sp.]